MIKKFTRFWFEERSLSVFLLLLVIHMFVIGSVVRPGLALDV
jgi:hypothetical protein